MARSQMGHTPAQLAHRVAHFGEPRRLPSDAFFADWARLRAAYRIAQGPEREALGEQLSAMQDYFYERAY